MNYGKQWRNAAREATGEYIGHCVPATQWKKEIQDAAAVHLAALNK